MKCLVLLALFGAAIAVPTQRIMGGTATTIQSHPFMSNLEYNWVGVTWSQSCTGSLITVRTILTAAQCYSGSAVSAWRVRLGNTIASGGSIHTIVGIAVHPNFNAATFVADIALVHLTSNAATSTSVGVARIPGTTYAVADNTPVVAIGWGSLTPGGPLNPTLQSAIVNVINHQTCAQRYTALKSQPGYSNWPSVTASMFCSGVLNVGGRDACHGDVGGPVTHQGDVILGIISWGYSCGDPNYPTVNTNVPTYSQWIQTNA